jgi:4-alpha-glucanotransferase
MDYQNFLDSASKRHWKKIGVNRRSGVNVPLFSIFSKQSIGIGDFRDLRALVDWCSFTHLSIIQLLPLNDVGYSFTPYDAQSTFALDSLYLCIDEIEGVDRASFKSDIVALNEQFPAGKERIDYALKKEKEKLLYKIFQAVQENLPQEFRDFCQKESFWLNDYALFKCLKRHFNEVHWQEWDKNYSSYHKENLKKIREERADEIRYFEWIQWQLFRQLAKAKAYANEKKVLIMGDLPFLVSRDSADVWANQAYFKLGKVAGAPPDAYIAKGQRWGMPPYCWEEIEKNGYDYLAQKVRYGSSFYNLLRIDHVVGMFRLWTIDENEPHDSGGRNGAFDPENEEEWEEHGRKLLQVMNDKGDMLCCAEDLGVVPDCSYKVLDEFAIPGMDIQRWTRNWETDQKFKTPDEYRKCSVTMLSTHDMPHFLGWWLCEVASVSEETIQKFCSDNDLDIDKVKDEFFSTSHEGFYQWKIKELDRQNFLDFLDVEEEKISWFIDLYETAEKDYIAFLEFVELKEKAELEKVVVAALEKAHESASIFSIQFIQDWLSLAGFYTDKPWSTRMNMPGTVKNENWSLVLPVSLEEMLVLGENKTIRQIVTNSGRAGHAS